MPDLQHKTIPPLIKMVSKIVPTVNSLNTFCMERIAETVMFGIDFVKFAPECWNCIYKSGFFL